MRPSFLALVMVILLAAGCRPAESQPAAGPQSLDNRFDQLIDPEAELELLAEGFGWSEGPIWRKSEGYLLFTDIPNNAIYRWSEEDGLSVFLRPSGYQMDDPPAGGLGSNGLIFDPEDRLVMADHGNRQINRLDESNFTKTPLATHFEGRRLNSPNDLVMHSSGDVYFTDPPYGLQGQHDSPLKELDFAGVFRLTPDGEVSLLDRELRFPNGIAFSPDERTLYVANSDPEHAVWMAYDVNEDGSVSNRRLLFDATDMVGANRPGLPDGLAIDGRGNLFATGPGGVLVITPGGEHLGTIRTPQATANVKFGDDGSVLYLTSHMNLYRIPTETRGVGF